MAGKKLVRIDRGDALNIYLNAVGIEVEAITPNKPDRNDEYSLSNCSLFFVPDKHVKTLVERAAKANPGCEIQVFSMEKVGQCPAGDFVMKDVTKDGILPL